MAYSDEVLSRAKTRLEQARQEQEQSERARVASILQKSPRLAEIDRALRKTSAHILAATFRDNQDPASAMARIRKDNTALQELCRQEQKKELAQALGAGYESFDRFRPELYSDEYNAAFRSSPRALMQAMHRRAAAYAQSFSPASPSLLFSGATGLGKTFLSACIARTVADQGHSVCYVTAEKLFSDFEAEKFRPRPDLSYTARYKSCDLLILDDLGTEMTTQLSIAALYQILNLRLAGAGPMIVSTNLTPDSFDGRYSAQIASRLNGMFELCQFCGEDIRMKLRGIKK